MKKLILMVFAVWALTSCDTALTVISGLAEVADAFAGSSSSTSLVDSNQSTGNVETQTRTKQRVERQCAYCKGSGQCIGCHGSGKSTTTRMGVKMNCTNCHGKGSCPNCKGSGVKVTYE